MNFPLFGPSHLILSLIEMVIGILLLINPVGFTSGIILALGVVLAVTGIGHVIGYFRADAEEAAYSGRLTKGVLLTAFGVFCVCKSDWLLVTFPVITVLYGVGILIVGVSKLQRAVDMIRFKRPYWFVALIGAVLTLVFAVLILCNPFASAVVLWTFIGVTCIVEAILDIAVYFFARKI